MEVESGASAGGASGSGGGQQSGRRSGAGQEASEPTGDRSGSGSAWTGYEWMQPTGTAEVGSEDEAEQAEETKRAAAASEPTAKEREQHELENHAVYRSWCPICIGARGLGTQHRRQKKDDADKEKD